MRVALGSDHAGWELKEELKKFLSANKIRGIYAALVDNTLSAGRARTHNDSNVLVLPGALIGKQLGTEILKIWLAAEYEGGRHDKRIKKIKEIESKLF